MNSFRLAVALSALLLCTLLFTACGKKEWPRPVLSEDTFALEEVAAHRQDDGCILVSFRVEGNAANLIALVLEVEVPPESGDLCTECPFDPQVFIRYEIDDPRLDFDGVFYRLLECSPQTTGATRIRLVGVNRFRTLDRVLSLPLFVQQDTGKNP